MPESKVAETLNTARKLLLAERSRKTKFGGKGLKSHWTSEQEQFYFEATDIGPKGGGLLLC